MAAPILVHLVRRTRARRVEFPALMFVRQVPQRSIRRQKLHNLVLLLLRALGILLIVLAFTRPFFSGGVVAGATQQQRASVILFDTSLSMKYGTHFEAAKKQALAVVDAARSDEQIALMSFGGGTQILSDLTADVGKIRATIESLTVSDEAADYAQAIKSAEALLKEQAGRGFQRIFLISDFQASNWRERNTAPPLPAELGLAALDVASEAASNVSVTDVNARGVVYGAKYPEVLTARVNNFGDAARERVEVTFQINDQTVERREIQLGAGDSAVLEFTGFNLAEGSNRCVISVGADEFTPDDAFHFTVRRDQPVRALILETATRGAGESLFLHQALTTGEGLPFALTVKSAGGIDPARLVDYELIVLNDAIAPGGQLIAALADYARRGGKLMVGVGPHTDAETFNRVFAEIAPAKLTGVVKRDRQDAVAIGDVQLDHPIFQIFRDGGQLAPLKVFSYHRAEPQADAKVVARFADGNPFLIESATGKLLLFTTALNTNWSDLPLTRLYLPLMQQMTRYLSERQEASSHTLGETFSVRASVGANEPPAVDTPGGERLRERTLARSGELLVNAREPGFYRMRREPVPDYVAVNTDRAESDFTKLNVDEFTASLRSADARTQPSAMSEPLPSREEIEARQKVWWPLLVTALILFAGEAMLARRTKMTRMIG